MCSIGSLSHCQLAVGAGVSSHICLNQHQTERGKYIQEGSRKGQLHSLIPSKEMNRTLDCLLDGRFLTTSNKILKCLPLRAHKTLE